MQPNGTVCVWRERERERERVGGAGVGGGGRGGGRGPHQRFVFQCLVAVHRQRASSRVLFMAERIPKAPSPPSASAPVM